GVGETEDAHAVAAPAQHVLRHLRLEPRDQTGDLAGTDIETGDDRRAARRNRLHLGRKAEAQHGHASAPTTVIPGQPEGLGPESRCKLSTKFWIPGSLLRSAPE